jgi:hypothetical protein
VRRDVLKSTSITLSRRLLRKNVLDERADSMLRPEGCKGLLTLVCSGIYWNTVFLIKITIMMEVGFHTDTQRSREALVMRQF